MPKNSRRRTGRTVLRDLLTYGTVAAALPALTGCGAPAHVSRGPVQDARPSQIAGTWRYAEGAEVVFRADGTAEVTMLDGQEVDYERDWRISGPATWELTADQPAGRTPGQHVRLYLPERFGAEWRSVAEAWDGTQREAAPPPEAYTWMFELRRDERGGLELYFYIGHWSDHVTYVLEKEA
ncbi:hypothetical protein [Streptomyces virginiae]|uniref:hypothetical protein n=1 Tax=Streptomyces virginiae TaxID=1961 RepID=UPI0006915C0E|nr:hypothetical protein [Streptomyces virginiae]